MKSLSEAPVGSIVRETTENYEAVVVGHQKHLNGCLRFVLQERRLKDGVPVKLEGCDIGACEIITRKGGPILDESYADSVMGLEALDTASGYKGKITIVDIGYSGDASHCLQTKERQSNGDRIDGIWVTFKRMELLEPARVKAAEPTVNRGPSKAPSRSESPM